MTTLIVQVIEVAERAAEEDGLKDVAERRLDLAFRFGANRGGQRAAGSRSGELRSTRAQDDEAAELDLEAGEVRTTL